MCIFLIVKMKVGYKLGAVKQQGSQLAPKYLNFNSKRRSVAFLHATFCS